MSMNTVLKNRQCENCTYKGTKQCKKNDFIRFTIYDKYECKNKKKEMMLYEYMYNFSKTDNRLCSKE